MVQDIVEPPTPTNAGPVINFQESGTSSFVKEKAEVGPSIKQTFKGSPIDCDNNGGVSVLKDGVSPENLCVCGGSKKTRS